MTGKEEAHVSGIDLDAQTRCAHYHKAQDIIAIKMKCCGVYDARTRLPPCLGRSP